MAQIEGGDGGGHGKHDKKKKAKKLSTRIDMTPMVDLAFLLLTFFVLTSTFSKPKVLKMVFPAKQDKQDPINKNVVKHGVTLILSGNNRIFYYVDKLTSKDSLKETTWGVNGIRAMLRRENKKFLVKYEDFQKRLNKLSATDTAGERKINKELETAIEKEAFIVIVKHDKDAEYSNMIDAVDEFLISHVYKYFVPDEPITKLEKEALDIAKAKK